MPWFFRVNNLESFEAASARLELCEARDLGAMPVEVEKITGSVGRWRDFDRHFRLKNSATRQRYQAILRKMKNGYTFPPVELYKVQDHYYVADGNHRVAAAKEIGAVFIDAHVREYFPCGNHENAIYWQERSAFEAVTKRTDVEFTNPDSYRRFLSHLRAFQAEESRRLGFDLALPAAVSTWFEVIDKPVREHVRADALTSKFEGRTEDDLVFYVTHHYVGMLRAVKGPDQVSYRDATARLMAMKGRTLAGRLQRYVQELGHFARDLVDNLVEMDFR